MRRFAAVSLTGMVMMLLMVTGCVNDPRPEFGEMTDVRDDQTYQTVKLGKQTWLAHDLNYETENSWCYGDDPANCDVYGRLYDWEAAMNACPAGWHLASDEEWSTLIKYLDRKADPSNWIESEIAGGMMKATGTIEDGTGLWNSPNKDATNLSGFSSVPGGARFDDGSCMVMGMHAIYWTSTEYDATSVWFRILDYGIGGIYRDNSNVTKTQGLSVRCIMD